MGGEWSVFRIAPYLRSGSPKCSSLVPALDYDRIEARQCVYGSTGCRLWEIMGSRATLGVDRGRVEVLDASFGPGVLSVLYMTMGYGFAFRYRDFGYCHGVSRYHEISPA